MTQRVLVFGGSGMLGQELVRFFGEGPYEVVHPSHKDVDVTDLERVARVVRETKPQIVLNAAVLVNVDVCEADPALADAVNAQGAQCIAEALQREEHADTAFVQFSSSDIFGSNFDAIPTEDETVFTPVNVYGHSKYSAEKNVREVLEGTKNALYIVRSSWIFSEFKKTFVDGIAEHIRKPVGTMQVADDQRGVPTWGREIAIRTRQLLEKPHPPGVYHFTPKTDGAAPTRFEIALEIARILGVKHPEALFSRASRNIIFKAPRPASSALTSKRFPYLPNWKESLRLFLQEKYPENDS